MLAIAALMVSMVFLGYRFASVVNSTSEVAMKKIRAEQLLHREGGSPGQKILHTKVSAVEQKLQDLSDEVSSVTSLLSMNMESAKRKSALEDQVATAREEIMALQHRLDNVTAYAAKVVQEQSQIASDSLQTQYKFFEDSYREAVGGIRRMEAKLAGFVEDSFSRQGSVHRWIVGEEEREGRLLGRSAAAPSSQSNNILDLDKIPFNSEMTISWRTECGCTGIGLEAMNLVYPLWKAGVKIWLNKCDNGCDFGMSPELQRMVDAMDKTRPQAKEARSSYYYSSSKSSTPHVYDIVVLHIAYAGICSTKDDRGDGHYIISRSMYEADTIKRSEVERCNSDKINEVWVPTEFNVDTFTSAGVQPSKLFQVGEGIDMYGTWSPEAAKSIEADVMAKLGINGTKAGWNLMSLFKFERRKNWKGLLRAYLTEFNKKDDICFYLKTHEGWEGNPEKWIKQYLRELISEKVINAKQLPCIFLVDSMIDAELLPKFFGEMDAFVLPSHAEGWGLPVLEAMAMELPVAVTDWGGVTQFSSGYSAHDRSHRDEWGRFTGGYAIRVERLEPAFDGNGAGNWAVPSVSHLKSILRHMYEHQMEARESGKLGRQRALRFDRNAVSARVLRNFNEIYEGHIAPKKALQLKKK